MPHEAGTSSHVVSIVPLELKLRQLRHRRRRAAMRQLVIATCWSLGLLGVAAFAIAVSVSVVHQ